MELWQTVPSWQGESVGDDEQSRLSGSSEALLRPLQSRMLNTIRKFKKWQHPFQGPKAELWNNGARPVSSAATYHAARTLKVLAPSPLLNTQLHFETPIQILNRGNRAAEYGVLQDLYARYSCSLDDTRITVLEGTQRIRRPSQRYSLVSRVGTVDSVSLVRATVLVLLTWSG